MFVSKVYHVAFYASTTFTLIRTISSFTVPPTARALLPVDRRRTSSFSSTKILMSLEPLAKEGPWTAYLDEDNTGLIYYFNTNTGESLWDPPTNTFPKIQMSKWKQEQMMTIQQRYNGQYAGGVSGTSGSYTDSNVVVNDGDNSGEEEIGLFSSWFTPRKSSDFEATAAVKGMVNGADEPSTAKTSTKNGTKNRNSEATAAVKGMVNGADAPTNFLSSIFDQSRPVKPKKQDNAAGEKNGDSTATNKKKSNQVNSSNGSSASPKLFKNFFGGATGTAKTTGATADEEELYVEEEIVEQFEEYYDQLQFEDAVLADKKEPKVEEEVIKPLKLEIASKVMPHPEKVSWGGEDSLFVSGRCFGVFDGVSGAEKIKGVPLYSNTLAQQLKASVGKQESLDTDQIKSKMLKAAQYADVTATGASTAVVASIGEDEMLNVVNLGDSVCLVVRDGSVAARAKETIHYFDCPYQLSEDSPDRPRSGSVLQTKLMRGDAVVLASDGVFDNLSDSEVCDIIVKKQKAGVSKITQEIVSQSRKVSKDSNAVTPYARMAKKNNYAAYSRGVGGKLDDISCIVVRCK
mmetsp:Transcript_3129/g.3624  ORF Transcript_3129/g.3624 Transcript_3129/m.3624 type:complete len:574 (-) Transcript_3129:133-1854(-)